MPRSGGPAREARRQQRLDARADGLAEHRRGAVRRDADDQRRAVDDGAELEGAKAGPVDHVDGHAGAARGAEDAGGFVLVRGGGNDERRAREGWGRPRGAPRARLSRPAASAASASISAQGARSHTSTVAPAAESSSAFHAAASLPPTTTTRRPASLKNSGSVASGSMRARADGARLPVGHGLRRAHGRPPVVPMQAADLGNAAAAVGAGAEPRSRSSPTCGRRPRLPPRCARRPPGSTRTRSGPRRRRLRAAAPASSARRSPAGMSRRSNCDFSHSGEGSLGSGPTNTSASRRPSCSTAAR